MELVESLLDTDTYTKLEIFNTYGNMIVSKYNKEKLAFLCQAGQFAPLKMPFKPTEAPGYFQYLSMT